MPSQSPGSKLLKYLKIWLNTVLIQISALCGTYGLLVTIYLILHFTVGERFIVVRMLNNTAHLLTLSCVPILLLTLVIKKYRFPWSLYILPSAIMFFVWYGADILPKVVTPSDDNAIELIVMTYNIRDSYRALRSVVENPWKADVIGLQEVPPRISSEFDEIYDASTQGIFAEYPIVSNGVERVYHLNSTRVGAIKAVIDVNGLAISIYSLHADRPALTLRPPAYISEPRQRDVASLVNAVTTDPNPVVVLCDCNFSDTTEDYYLMTTELLDAWKQKGVGMGLTAPAPAGGAGFPFLLLRSDYIWHSDDFETLSIEVLPKTQSDHYPVLAHLRLHNR